MLCFLRKGRLKQQMALSHKRYQQNLVFCHTFLEPVNILLVWGYMLYLPFLDKQCMPHFDMFRRHPSSRRSAAVFSAIWSEASHSNRPKRLTPVMW